MRCPNCTETGAAHTVTQGAERSTMVRHGGHWDAQDVYHDHNPNTYTNSYTCSNGHAWTQARPSVPCPAKGCPWKGPNPLTAGQQTNIAVPVTFPEAVAADPVISTTEQPVFAAGGTTTALPPAAPGTVIQA